MKTFYDWKLILFLLMVGVGIVACSGDDNNSEVIDGVNVIKGKKLAEIKIYYEGTSKIAGYFKIEYDTKDRLSRVVEVNYNQGQIFDLLKIDYDTREIYLLEDYGRTLHYLFMLNKEGYVSQIGICGLEYDKNGYLTGGYSTSQILQLVHSEGKIIQSVIEEISSNNISTNYFSYSGDSGELYITMNSNKKYRGITNVRLAIACLIAYQSGLFGKTDIHTNTLSKSSMTKAVVKKTTPDATITINCDLMYE